jgi:hypothetical protein
VKEMFGQNNIGSVSPSPAKKRLFHLVLNVLPTSAYLSSLGTIEVPASRQIAQEKDIMPRVCRTYGQQISTKSMSYQ